MASPPAPRKALGEGSKGSAETKKVPGETRKGSRDSRNISDDLKKDSREARKNPDEAKKGTADVRRPNFSWRGSPGTKRWNFSEDRKLTVADSKRLSADRKRLSVADSRRLSVVDSRRLSVDNEMLSVDNEMFSGSRKGSEEARESWASIPSSVQPCKVSWTMLMRALGRFKLHLPRIRRAHMLSAKDPLAVEKDFLPPVKFKAPVKTWGNHQALAKIPFKILTGHQHIVTSCHFCVNDTKLLTASYDCSVKMWDAAMGSVIWDFEPRPKAPVLECSITADSRRIVASSYDKTVRAWDVQTGQLLWRVRHDTFIVCCKFSPDGKYVLAALDVGRGICLMDPDNITTVTQIKDHHKRSITACCFDPDSQKVASVSMDRSIKIWDISSQGMLFTIPKAHTNAISDCCFTLSGHFLCTSSWDKNIKIWNVHTGEFRNRGACVTLAQGHDGCVSSCCISRDSSLLISGGFDNTVTIWDVGDGYRKLSLKGHDNWVMDVAISNNKKWILSASKDTSLRLWNIEDIDQIPLVSEKKKSSGINVRQCKRCHQLFSTFDYDTSFKLPKRCMFCWQEEKDIPDYSSSSEEDSKEC